MKPKTKHRKFTVGVAGTGFMGENHVRVVSLMRGARLGGIFDGDPARAEVISIKYNTKCFASFGELLSEVDAVIIATPTSTHYEYASATIGAGKHVFVEKPLAGNALDGEKLTAMAMEKKIVLTCGFIERFNPAFTIAYSLISKDRPLIVNLRRESPLPARITDASVVFDMMIHDLDLAIKISGAPVADFKAKGRKSKTKNIDIASASILFRNGIIANVGANRVAAEKVRTLSVECEHSTVKADLLSRTVIQKFPPDPASPTLEGPKEVSYPVVAADQITLELKDFFRAIKSGKDPEVTGRDALASLRLAEEIENKILKR